MSCLFWWFFESVGSQKRFHTLPAPTSIKKYICNIKIKIIFFSTWFSCDFGIDFHRKIDAFCCKTLTFLNTLTRKGIFHCKKHHFFDENRSQNHMKTMSKKYNFYFYVDIVILRSLVTRKLSGNSYIRIYCNYRIKVNSPKLSKMDSLGNNLQKKVLEDFV